MHDPHRHHHRSLSFIVCMNSIFHLHSLIEQIWIEKLEKYSRERGPLRSIKDADWAYRRGIGQFERENRRVIRGTNRCAHVRHLYPFFSFSLFLFFFWSAHRHHRYFCSFMQIEKKKKREMGCKSTQFLHPMDEMAVIGKTRTPTITHLIGL